MVTRQKVDEMKLYERRLAFLEFVYGKPWVTFPEVATVWGTSEVATRETSDELRDPLEHSGDPCAGLQTRNDQLKAYAHMVAHELKDPLASIVVTSDLINNIPGLTRQELNDYTQQIRSTAYEMNKIIDSLLLLAEVSKAQVPVEPVDSAGVVANVRDRLSSMIRQHQAQINLPPIWPDALGYAPWIEEVWANYISNAIRYGGRPPQVELGAAAQPDGTIRFWTRDNGPGIPPYTRMNLFTPFGRVRHPGNPGHGLGLSIVSQIVEKLGGEVGVESEVGKGSLFYFTLPASQAPAQQNQAPVLSDSGG